MMWGLKPNSLTTAGASHPLTIKQCDVQPWKFQIDIQAPLLAPAYSPLYCLFELLAYLDRLEIYLLFQHNLFIIKRMVKRENQTPCVSHR